MSARPLCSGVLLGCAALALPAIAPAASLEKPETLRLKLDRPLTERSDPTVFLAGDGRLVIQCISGFGRDTVCDIVFLNGKGEPARKLSLITTVKTASLNALYITKEGDIFGYRADFPRLGYLVKISADGKLLWKRELDKDEAVRKTELPQRTIDVGLGDAPHVKIREGPDDNSLALSWAGHMFRSTVSVTFSKADGQVSRCDELIRTPSGALYLVANGTALWRMKDDTNIANDSNDWKEFKLSSYDFYQGKLVLQLADHVTKRGKVYLVEDDKLKELSADELPWPVRCNGTHLYYLDIPGNTLTTWKIKPE